MAEIPEYLHLVDWAKPRFEHDCDGCVFLGRFGEKDVWLCAREGQQDYSLLLRYGNEPWEYSSGHGMPVFRLGQQGGTVWNFEELNLISELVGKGIIDRRYMPLDLDKVRLYKRMWELTKNEEAEEVM